MELLDSTALLVWRYSEGEGYSALDHSGNSNHGQTVGAPTWVASSAPVGTSITTEVNSAVVVRLNGTTTELGASLQFNITRLPELGTLYQTTASLSQGAAILAAPTAVTGPGGRVLYQPAQGSWGSPYATFGFDVHDGTAWSSATANITVHVTAEKEAPVLEYELGSNTTLLQYG